MKQYKQILEAINKGIQLALDDFENIEDNNSIHSDIINTNDIIKQKVELSKLTIDLGLPSGTLWCKYNLGSTIDKNYGHFAFDFYGNYYAWGETKEKINYTWDTLTFYEKNLILSKYNEYDELKQLLPEDDVAYKRQECHNFKFHIPTKEQCEELLKYTDNYFIKYTNTTIKKLYGNNIKTLHGDLYGVLFISKINQNLLFFPAAGYKNGSQAEDMKIAGGIWTATNAFEYKDIQNYNKAFFLHFDNKDRPAAYIDIDYRCRGLNIRPVINLNEQ